jgi:hypothetical protein
MRIFPPESCTPHATAWSKLHSLLVVGARAFHRDDASIGQPAHASSASIELPDQTSNGAPIESSKHDIDWNQLSPINNDAINIPSCDQRELCIVLVRRVYVKRH